MRVRAIDHVVLCVADVEATIAWYRDLLGMEPREERPGKWSLHVGEQKVSLQDARTAPAIAADTVPGSGNLCFLADDPVDELLPVLAQHGVAVVAGPDERAGATGPLWSVYVRDPDGNLVEVSNVALRRGGLLVRPVSGAVPAVQRLAVALTEELASHYTAAQTFGIPPGDLASSGVRLFGAFDPDGVLVAIGGLGVDEHGAEVKRFYVLPEARGSGAADVVLDAVLERARRDGVDVVRLETGDQQHAAMRFYERRGFVPIEPFGPYVDSSTSRCYELRL